MRPSTRHEIDGVGQDVEHRLQRLDRPLGRTGGVQDQRRSEGAGDRPTEPTETGRVARAHGLGQTGCIAIDHRGRALRREIAGTESRAAGGDDQPGEAVGELDQRVADRLDPVRDLAPIDDVPEWRGKQRIELQSC